MSEQTASSRHDWYQTDTSVVVSVLLKNAQEKNLFIDIQSERLQVTADGYELDVELYHPIDTERSKHTVFTSKVEIKLAKTVGERWESLRKVKNAALPPVTAQPPPIHKKNWDSLAKEVEKSEAENAKGEDALNRLFKQIYNSSDPKVQMAMNKSFQESGGTVLSTNWNEVKQDKVEVKPPEGTEFRKWD